MLDALSARLHLHGVPSVVPQQPRRKLHSLQVPSLFVLHLTTSACAATATAAIKANNVIMLLETRSGHHDDGAASDEPVFSGSEPGRAKRMDGGDAAALAQLHITRHCRR